MLRCGETYAGDAIETNGGVGGSEGRLHLTERLGRIEAWSPGERTLCPGLEGTFRDHGRTFWDRDGQTHILRFWLWLLNLSLGTHSLGTFILELGLGLCLSLDSSLLPQNLLLGGKFLLLQGQLLLPLKIRILSLLLWCLSFWCSLFLGCRRQPPPGRGHLQHFPAGSHPPARGHWEE